MLPIIGNLHQLGFLPHRSLHALSDKLGPLILLRLGQVPLLVVSSPDMAREVMKTQDHVFANRPSLKVTKQLLYEGRDIASAPYGEYWRHVRKISILHLLSSKRVQSYRLIREEEVVFMIEKISRSSSFGPVNVSEALNSLAKGVISRVTLGKCSREEGWDEVIHKLIEESSALIGAFHVGDFFPSLAWLGAVTGLDRRVRRIFKQVDGILGEIIENHVNRSRVDDGHENDDFVDALLSVEKDPNKEFPFDKENVKAIVEDMFGAGTDSTYITMEWAMAEIVRNPHVMKKLQDEVGRIAGSKAVIDEDDLTEMHYLKAVIKESLRLHPTGPLLVPRESMEDTQIQGYEIPKKTRLLINVWAIGRDPKVWEAPEEFRPERFMGSPVDFKGHDFQLIPFGAGRRVCPGIQFAVPVIELALANLVHRFDWKLPDGMGEEGLDMIEAPGLTTRKRVSLRLTATPRSY